MNFLVRPVTGACAGPLAAMIMQQNIGRLANVAFGIAGAFIGGMLWAHGDIANGPLTITTFCVSLIGAIAIARPCKCHARRRVTPKIAKPIY